MGATEEGGGDSAGQAAHLEGPLSSSSGAGDSNADEGGKAATASLNTSSRRGVVTRTKAQGDAGSAVLFCRLIGSSLQRVSTGRISCRECGKTVSGVYTRQVQTTNKRSDCRQLDHPFDRKYQCNISTRISRACTDAEEGKGVAA